MVYSAYLINLGITYQRIEITNINIVLLEMMFNFFFMSTWPTLTGHTIPFSFWVLLLSISFWFNSVLIYASVRLLTFLRFALLKSPQPPFIPALRYYLFCFFHHGSSNYQLQFVTLEMQLSLIPNCSLWLVLRLLTFIFFSSKVLQSIDSLHNLFSLIDT